MSSVNIVFSFGTHTVDERLSSAFVTNRLHYKNDYMEGCTKVHHSAYCSTITLYVSANSWGELLYKNSSLGKLVDELIAQWWERGGVAPLTWVRPLFRSNLASHILSLTYAAGFLPSWSSFKSWQVKNSSNTPAKKQFIKHFQYIAK